MIDLDSSSCDSSDDYMRDYCSDTDSLVVCTYCHRPVIERNYQNHIDNVHRCPYCPKTMKKRFIKGHIEKRHEVQSKNCSVRMVANEIGAHEATHYTPCKYCPKNILEQNMQKHVADLHSMDTIIGMIQLKNITVSRVKELLAQNRIDVNEDGSIFIKPQ